MPGSRQKTVDSKGRLALGKQYAHQTVLIEEVDGLEIIVTLASVVPKREAWLLRNPKANQSLDRGLEQARNRQFGEGPDLAAAAALAEQLEDE